MSELVEMDHIGRLHDSELLHIFNRIGDFKALCRCCAVSTRFYHLATQVDNVVVKVDPAAISSSRGDDKTSLSAFMPVFIIGIVTPLRLLGPSLGPVPKTRPAAGSGVSFPWPVLKRFSQIRALKIEFTGWCLGIDVADGVFLKWKAEFGPSFRKFVILAAENNIKRPVSRSSKRKRASVAFGLDVINSISSINPIISAMRPIIFCEVGSDHVAKFATSARRSLLRIIAEHSKLDSLVVTDADGGGAFCMTSLQELTTSSSSDKSSPPLVRLNTRAWDAGVVRLTNGGVLKGAVLAAVWSGEGEQPLTCDLADTFEEPYETALRNLISINEV